MRKKTEDQCSEPKCEKSVPYTDWKTCEEHNPFKRLLESRPSNVEREER